MRILNSCGL